jgi:hypothetical protein
MNGQCYKVLPVNKQKLHMYVVFICSLVALYNIDHSYVVFVCSLVALYNIDRSYVVFVCSLVALKTTYERSML